MDRAEFLLQALNSSETQCLGQVAGGVRSPSSMAHYSSSDQLSPKTMPRSMGVQLMLSASTYTWRTHPFTKTASKPHST